jgi:hypothetical protein
VKNMKTFRLLCALFMVSGSASLAFCQVRVVGSGPYYPVPIQAAPGEVVTFYVTGLQLRLDEPLYAEGPQLPEALGGISVIIRDHRESKNYIAPILSIKAYSNCTGLDKTDPACLTFGVTAQVPLELSPNSPPSISRRQGLGGNQFPSISHDSIDAFSVVIVENEVESAPFLLMLVNSNLRVLNECDGVFLTELSPYAGCPKAVRRQDNSPGRPRLGETVRIYLTGLRGNPLNLRTGATIPKALLVSGSITLNHLGSVPGAPPSSLSTPYLVDPSSLSDLFMAPGMYGVYYVDYKLPSVFPPLTGRCAGSFGSNMTLIVATKPSTLVGIGTAPFDNIRFCVEP